VSFACGTIATPEVTHIEIEIEIEIVYNMYRVKPVDVSRPSQLYNARNLQVKARPRAA
jgi:hypothetical protein